MGLSLSEDACVSILKLVNSTSLCAKVDYSKSTYFTFCLPSGSKSNSAQVDGYFPSHSYTMAGRHHVLLKLKKIGCSLQQYDKKFQKMRVPSLKHSRSSQGLALEYS